MRGPETRRITCIPKGCPVVCNCGVGVDSVALLCELVRQEIVPDLILFADPGAERCETYAYLRYFNDWLKKQGFPGITRVVLPPTPRYSTIEGNMLANETLPSISFWCRGCSLRWKASAMDRYLLGCSRGPNAAPGWPPAVEALLTHRRVVKLVGYDAGPADRGRGKDLKDDHRFHYVYPLRELGWRREECIARIREAGLVVPLKSACYFCAVSREWELYWLCAAHPDLVARALFLEDRARNGRHGLRKVNGLWGQGKPSWRAFCEAEQIVEPGGYSVVAYPERMLEKARRGMPACEGNLEFPLPCAASLPEPEYDPLPPSKRGGKHRRKGQLGLFGEEPDD